MTPENLFRIRCVQSSSHPEREWTYNEIVKNLCVQLNKTWAKNQFENPKILKTLKTK